jgi:hypothetical protein
MTKRHDFGGPIEAFNQRTALRFRIDAARRGQIPGLAPPGPCGAIRKDGAVCSRTAVRKGSRCAIHEHHARARDTTPASE